MYFVQVNANYVQRRKWTKPKQEPFQPKFLIDDSVLRKRYDAVIDYRASSYRTISQSLSDQEYEYIEEVVQLISATNGIMISLKVPIFGYDWTELKSESKFDSDTEEKLSRIITFISGFTIQITDEYLNAVFGNYVNLTKQQSTLKRHHVKARDKFIHLTQLVASIKNEIIIKDGIIQNIGKDITKYMQKFLEPSKNIGTKLFNSNKTKTPVGDIRSDVKKLELLRNQLSNADISKIHDCIAEINYYLLQIKEAHLLLQKEIENLLHDIYDTGNARIRTKLSKILQSKWKEI